MKIHNTPNQKQVSSLFKIKQFAIVIVAFLMCNTIFAQMPGTWTVNPSSFSNTASVTCKINQSCFDLTNPNNAVAAFVGGQCRGVANTNIFVSSTGDQVATLTVYSNVSSGEAITFQAYNDASNSVFNGVDTLIFVADNVFGSLTVPFVVTENHTPTDISVSNLTMSEDANVGDIVGALTATDDNVPNVFTFSLTPGFQDNDNYLISGSDLTLNTTLDFASDPTDTITITVADASGCEYSEEFIITIADMVYPPEANADVYILDEDQDSLLHILNNDSDLDNNIDTSSLQITVSPLLGTAVIDTMGNIEYTPFPNVSGNDTIIYNLCDYSSPTPLCDTAIVVITIMQIDDAPVALKDSINTLEDIPVSIMVLNNDSDQDNNLDTTSLSIISGPSHGSLLIGANGEIDYTPASFYTGMDTLVYEICDLTTPTPLCSSAMVVITVIPVPNPPLAENDTVNVDEDVNLDIYVLANDTDPDNDIDSSSVNIYLNPSNGTASVDSVGKVTYVPGPNFNGIDSLYYSVCDLTATTPICDTAVVYMTVDAVDDTPEVNVDSYAIIEDTPTDFYVVNNDFDVDNNLDTLSLTVITNPSNGTASINTDGSINYIPNTFFNGNDTIVYQFCDLTSPTALCDTAIVLITVIAVPNPPVALNDTVNLDEDTTLDIVVLANDSDPDNDIDSSSVSVYVGPFNGTVTVDSIGTVTYVPNPNFNGTDSLYYAVCDLTGTTPICDTAVVYITVDPIDDTPEVNADNYTVIEDTPTDFYILNNDSDADNNLDSASLSILTNPSNGVVTINADWSIHYVPNLYFNGNDTLVYQICDFTSPTPLCDTAIVIITIIAVPNAPEAYNDTLTVDEDILGTIQVLTNDFDADNDIDSSSVTIYLGPQNGTASVDTLGNLSYQSNLNFNGLDSLYYVVCDQTLTGALCDTAMVYIIVLPIPDAPQAINDSINTPEDTSVDIDVLLNDTDPENDIDPASLTIITNPVNGVATVVGGQISYVPNSFYYGLDSLVYQVCDLTAPVPLCDTAVVYITIDLVPNAPIDLIIDTLFVNEDNNYHQRISTIRVVDNDLVDSFQYELISGLGDEDNLQFSIEDSTLYIETKTNFDIKQQYNFRVLVTDSFGLTYEEAFVLEVLDVEGNSIPLPSANFLSPNGDGKNDYWKVENVEIYADFSLTILDQFGFVVYSINEGYDNSWDGTYNGTPLNTGNYYYIFQRDSKVYKGNITIVNN